MSQVVCYRFITCVKISFLCQCPGSSVCACDCMHVSFLISLCDTHHSSACVCVCLGGHAIDQAPQLFDHSLYQLLFVSVVLPELREDVVLLTGVLHPGHRDRQRGSERQVTQMYSLCTICSKLKWRHRCILSLLFVTLNLLFHQTWLYHNSIWIG